uniref:Polyprenyl synthetase n=1 Tax=Anopheles epiroticus TaxID=199890 RepID=A0A182PE97_9DIPT
MISEMIHTASLVHDDVIDQSFARRGKPSVNVLWNHKKAFGTCRCFLPFRGLRGVGLCENIREQSINSRIVTEIRKRKRYGVTQAGDYILAVASMLLARLKHDEVTHILSQF